MLYMTPAPKRVTTPPSKNIKIFDLDGTVVDSYHRVQHALASGEFCLQTYIRECNTPELIAQDGLLPLSAYMISLAEKGEQFAIITARFTSDADHAFLKSNGLVNEHTITLCRATVSEQIRSLSDAQYKVYQLNRLKAQFPEDTNFLMYDDVPEVIEAMQSQGIICLDAVHVNKILAQGVAGHALNPEQLLHVIGG